MSDVTQILSRIEQGDPQAAEKLLPLVYEELRTLARLKLANEKPGQTLQPTALVHEAYVRLVAPEEQQHWDSRSHFYGAAAEAMRRILVENARRRRRLKRGHGLERQSLDEQAIAAPEVDRDLVQLDTALERLAAKDPRAAELIKLRFFVGLTIQESAQILGVSVPTANRDWNYARAWLFSDISEGHESDQS